jgi:DNA-binding NtrC family response regulator
MVGIQPGRGTPCMLSSINALNIPDIENANYPTDSGRDYRGPDSLKALEKNEPPEILIVEDDFSLETVLVHVLHRIDTRLKIKWATNLSEAQKYLQEMHKQEDPKLCLVLCDILLPNFENGIPIWKYVRDHFRDTPFVFMSGVSSDNYLKLMASESAWPPFISKPFRVIDWKNIVESQLFASPKFT